MAEAVRSCFLLSFAVTYNKSIKLFIVGKSNCVCALRMFILYFGAGKIENVVEHKETFFFQKKELSKRSS